MFIKETAYIVYSNWEGSAFHTLYVCKTKETAQYFLDLEHAYQYNHWYDNKEVFGGISWERYESECGAKFCIQEIDLFE